ncbi:polymer-forming cytoskeletal protein [Thauera sp. JM12B12]|uniref:bactofilin family protein n=1 Tax=Thauera sp. JM12B12 TaxID=3142262 RepID=UPI0031F4399B
MFNKSNLFHKPADSAALRTAQRPVGSSVSATSTAATADAVAASSAATGAGERVPKGDVQGAREAESVAETTGVEATGESRLIVGPEVKLKGAEILDCDTLVVEGRVEATMDSRVLRIAEKGAYKGTVGIDIAEIHGHFEGELTARKQLLIHATGQVSGKIRYGKILIEEGGELSGDVQSLSASGKEGLRAVEAKQQDARPLAAVAG